MQYIYTLLKTYKKQRGTQ